MKSMSLRLIRRYSLVDVHLTNEICTQFDYEVMDWLEQVHVKEVVKFRPRNDGPPYP